jgi:hypothetical protein
LVLRSHLAVDRFLGYVVFLRRTAPTTVKRPVRPLFEFCFPPEFCPTCLARRPQSADTSHGLSFPSAHAGSKVHLARVCQPATFRLQGLVTLLAACSLRALAGFLSHRRRSWDSPFGAFSSRKVSAASPRGWTHVPFLPSVIPPPKRWAGPTGRGFWAFTLPGVPRSRTGVSSPTAGCSLGFHPPRACGWRLAQDSAQAPPTRFAVPATRAATTGASEYRSARTSLAPAARRTRQPDRAALSGFLHQHDPAHSSDLLPGL